MRKKFMMNCLISSILLATSTGFAAADASQDLQISGSILFHYRIQRDEQYPQGAPDITRNGFKTLFLLNMDQKLNENFALYARATYEAFSSRYGNFGTDNYVDRNYHGAIDEYGLKYNHAGYTYKLGLQSLTLGGGLVYDNGYIGKHSLPYALTMDGKVGKIDVNVVAAQTNYQGSLENDKFYAVQGSYAMKDKASVGAMIVHADYGKDTTNAYMGGRSSVNYYSVYGSYPLSDKLTISAEYLLSSMKKDNQAHIAQLSYSTDSKNTFGLGYYRVEDQTSINDYNAGCMTTSPNTNTKGYLVSFKHKFDKNVSWSVSDFHYDKINSSSSNGASTNRNRFGTTLAIAF
ncbi:hypothetical protein Ga0466249_000355 [Sporomusaceae bacterium BoRhaA]|uniref:hypothetical protein n=1 Tax=Pelorhabdus rhamnosifermentans TaxID=2772457 RepID=UPI001C063A8B|nr:hypothetical protein [Pelorhabdus rhamnosifermentans]MBU2699276.1 hypothetical protein [Pelorhabdus rhamnosifermentans]